MSQQDLKGWFVRQIAMLVLILLSNQRIFTRKFSVKLHFSAELNVNKLSRLVVELKFSRQIKVVNRVKNHVLSRFFSANNFLTIFFRQIKTVQNRSNFTIFSAK